MKKVWNAYVRIKNETMTAMMMIAVHSMSARRRGFGGFAGGVGSDGASDVKSPEDSGGGESDTYQG
jgi:hypothetical protein